MASEHETATDYFQAIAQAWREHGLMGAPDTTQDRWGTERKVKSLRLTVGENDFFIEGENLTLDAEFFKLIDIWVKAITPEAPQQAAIDKLATTVGTKAADLQAVVDANKGK